MKAEILAGEKNYAEAISYLKRAIAEEDNLNYNEPPDWFFSVRHNLGAVQIEAQEFKEAIKTYQEDLVNYPRNGWALHGMKLAYNNIGNDNKVGEISDQLEEIWSTADIKIKSSRIMDMQ
ncbi:MAG TPA: hypothetical protein VKA10_10820 [Prolixibacteraceae bacterium]|nr:hypothetical protein [Prolixibacteraceae bacterium]